MRFYIISFIFLIIIACQNNQEEKNENIPSEYFETEINKDTLKSSDKSEERTEFDLYCSEEGLIRTEDTVSYFISAEGLKLINDAISSFYAINTDSDMADFYHNHLFEAADSLENIFHKYQALSEASEGYLIEEWNDAIGNCIPFMIYVFDNTFDGPSGYIHIQALYEKAEKTKGRGDDVFFEADMRCSGEYESSYSSLHFEMIACDIATSTYGGGFHYDALKSVMKADSVSDLFKKELDHMAKNILSEEKIVTFGYSEEEVYKEIELILNLRDSTNYDYSKLLNLKMFLDTTSQKLYFNCLDGSCPP